MPCKQKSKKPTGHIDEVVDTLGQVLVHLRSSGLQRVVQYKALFRRQ